MFVESAGRPEVIAGTDPADAAGLTQILASTGQSLLGMHIDLARSRRLTSGSTRCRAGASARAAGAAAARRAAADPRFYPAKALAATVRYLQIAEHQFGRQDLAFESYHMGIGNLHNVLGAYDGGRPVPYVQLYFDSAPDHHPAAYQLLAGFGDDSSLYYWRLLGAEQIMHLYRTDRAALRRLASLQTADGAERAGAAPAGPHAALRGPGRAGRRLPAPARAAARQRAPRSDWPMTRRWAPGAAKVGGRPRCTAACAGRPAAADRARRPGSGRCRRGRRRCGSRALVSDASYERQIGQVLPAATTGYTFTDRTPLRQRRPGRRLSGDARPPAVAEPDRLGARTDGIDVTVASDAGTGERRLRVRGRLPAR